nr:cytochrome P450 [Agasicles hygrophila]
MLLRIYKDAGNERYYGFYQFSTPTLLIKDPELIKQIGVKDFEHFLDHSTFIPENADPLWGKNLFALKGQRWRDMRPILSPSFTSSKMKVMFQLMHDCANNFTDFFLKKNENVIEVKLKDIFTRYTNDVIGTTAFGIKTNSLENPDNEFYRMGKEATDLTSLRKNLKFFGYLIFPRLLEFLKVKLFESHVAAFFTNLIDNAIKVRREKGIIRPDMIHLLMEAQKLGANSKEEHNVDNGFATVKESDLGKPNIHHRALTNLDITAQALIFFFAGFDSVSSVMGFMAYELAVNPDIQNRLREEILETAEECKEELTYDVILKMKYLDMVLSETLRKWPNAIAVDRVCTKPYIIEPATPNEKPLYIKEGTLIWFPIYAIHHDPEYYSDPDKFDPERFSDENKGNIDPYKYIPFGIGPRNCIGNRFALLEIKVIMFHILSHFEIVPIANSQIPVIPSKKQFNLIPDDGFQFGLKHIGTKKVYSTVK